MRKSEYSDKQLEDLLRQMPKIKDHRDPRDIYQNLSLKKRKLPMWFLPGVAAAAALFLIILLVPQLMNDRSELSSEKKAEKISVENNANMAMDRSSPKIEADLKAKEEGAAGTENQLFKVENMKTALYENEADNGRIFTYWIPDSQGQILIPVSTIVKEDENKDWLTLFTESMGKLKEQEWSLTDYYPLNVTFGLDNTDNSVTVDVPEDHLYGQGSTEETLFVNSLIRNIASNSDIKKLKFTTAGKIGIELGNFGRKEELEIEPEGNHAYFFYYFDKNETPFLVPSNDKYSNLEEALEAMNSDQPELGLQASRLPSLKYKASSIENGNLKIVLDDNAVLEDDQATLLSFEALLLTAKEFGIETIQLENPPINQLGPFDLTLPTKVPLSANYRSIE